MSHRTPEKATISTLSMLACCELQQGITVQRHHEIECQKLGKSFGTCMGLSGIRYAWSPARNTASPVPR